MTSKEEIIKIQISRVEKEIRDTPYDKASEHHHGVLKAKLAKLKEQLEDGAARGGGGGGGIGYAIRHSGDASVVLVGLPSVGKSTLLNALTNAESKVGNYDFTTLGVVPGMLNHKGVAIQILDLPGIIEGGAKDRGFGKKVLSVVRASDLAILICDINRISWFEKVEKELYDAGIRANLTPPKVIIHKTSKGSVQVVNPFGGLSHQTVVEVAKEMGLGNARIIFQEKIDNIDLLLDAFSKNRRYMPIMKVVTKLDLASEKQLKQLTPDLVRLSVLGQKGIDDLKERLWRELGLLRVYLKPERVSPADKEMPMIMRRGQTVKQVLQKISNQMSQDITRAYVWGKEARFAGQEVSFSFPVFDEMEIWFGR